MSSRPSAVTGATSSVENTSTVPPATGGLQLVVTWDQVSPAS